MGKEVPQELQESRIDENVAPATLGPILSGPVNWLRLAYAFEFLIALLVSVVLWTQVGGQGHMDLIAWYLKLPCMLVQAWCAVRFTAALVEEPKAWNRRSRWWFSGLLLTGALMALITLYYHLHEVTDEDNSDEINASMIISGVAKAVFPA